MKKYVGLVLVGAMVAFGAGCSDDGGGGGTGGGTGGTGGGAGGDSGAGGGGMVNNPCVTPGDNIVVDTDEINQDTFWPADCTYELNQLTYVVDANLEIEAGTTITGGTNSALIISNSGTITAEGTVDAPIVFTSNRADAAKAPVTGPVSYCSASRS